MKRAYAPLFDSDQGASKLVGDKLKSLVAQVAGTDADMTARTASTFLALVNLADFEATSKEEEPKKGFEQAADLPADQDDERDPLPSRPKGLRTEFHYNLQIQLPSNGTEETYLNIFNAIRKTFQ